MQMWDMIINEQLTPNAHLGLNEKWGDQWLFNQKDRHRKAWLFLCGQTWLFSFNANHDLQILRFLNGKKEYVNNYFHPFSQVKETTAGNHGFYRQIWGFNRQVPFNLGTPFQPSKWMKCPSSRGRFGKYHQQAKKQVRKILENPKGIW